MVLDRAAVLTLPGVLSDAEQQAAAAVLGSRVDGPLGGAIAADAALILGPPPQLQYPPAYPADVFPQPGGGVYAPQPMGPPPDATGAPGPIPYPSRAGRGGAPLLLLAVALAVVALFVPLAALVAVAVGVFAIVRGRIFGGALACLLAVVLGFVGQTVWREVTFDVPATVVGRVPAADKNALDDYFQDRYHACLLGQTPEGRTQCRVNLDGDQQLALVSGRGYFRCRQQQPVAVCVQLLRGRGGSWPPMPQVAQS
jgi:hypothetical protein